METQRVFTCCQAKPKPWWKPKSDCNGKRSGQETSFIFLVEQNTRGAMFLASRRRQAHSYTGRRSASHRNIRALWVLARESRRKRSSGNRAGLEIAIQRAMPAPKGDKGYGPNSLRHSSTTRRVGASEWLA